LKTIRRDEYSRAMAARGMQSVISLKLSPTEQRHPRSMNLDKLPLRQAITLMLSEDAKVPKKLLKKTRQIESAIQAIVRAFTRGGRLFYGGAGTSGRLGVLDASECRATFRTAPEMVQGIIAGGESAVWKSVQGAEAEDDPQAGAAAVAARKMNSRDVVVGITASGTAPFVWGALTQASHEEPPQFCSASIPSSKFPLPCGPKLCWRRILDLNS
jgi:N-acetylmuramic acid 6-phosphate etherase